MEECIMSMEPYIEKKTCEKRRNKTFSYVVKKVKNIK